MPKLKITCEYCEVFKHSKRIEGRRFCNKLKTKVKSTSKICDKFEPVKDIFCNNLRRQYWIDLIVCYKKRKDRTYGCNTCKQGKIVKIIKEIYLDG